MIYQSDEIVWKPPFLPLGAAQRKRRPVIGLWRQVDLSVAATYFYNDLSVPWVISPFHPGGFPTIERIIDVPNSHWLWLTYG